MNHVLYEASFKFEPVFLIPIVMLIFIAKFPYMAKQADILNGNKVQHDYRLIKAFSIGGFAFVAICLIISVLFQLDMYNKTVKEYKRGNYQIVEGYVENFVPLSHYDNKDETFDINGISFSYSNAEIQPGYNKPKIHGGVITGDGQHLKIGYVYYNRSYGNIIVYIEELD